MVSLIIVEDDPSLLAGMSDVLRFEGNEVQAVSSGQAAIETIETHSPDLIISDLLMPEMDGLQLLKEVRARPDGRNVPFLFVSAMTEPEPAQLLAGLEAVFLLPKPFEIDVLNAAVLAALDGQQD